MTKLLSDALPKKAKTSLIGSLSNEPGTQLSISWYEYMSNSNFDTYPRETIRDAAEADGFVEYKSGHPWVTEAGHAWALLQKSK